MKIIALGCSHTFGHELSQYHLDDAKAHYKKAIGVEPILDKYGEVTNTTPGCAYNWDIYQQNYFGKDKWIELCNMESWTGQLGNMLNLPVVNYGRCGGTNIAALASLIKSDYQQGDIVLWGVTASHRDTYFTDDDMATLVNVSQPGMLKQTQKEIDSYRTSTAKRGTDIFSKILSLYTDIEYSVNNYNATCVNMLGGYRELHTTIDRWDLMNRFPKGIRNSSHSQFLDKLQKKFNNILLPGFDDMPRKTERTFFGHYSPNIHKRFAQSILPLIKEKYGL